MLRVLLRSRIQRLNVTAINADEDESLAVDRDLLRQAGIWPYERVDVANHDNGARFSLQVTEAPAGSGIVAVHGAASHLVRVGHKITVSGYLVMGETDIPKYSQRIVKVSKDNRFVTP